MAVEQRWIYERVASGADANGETCVFCKQPIVNETQAGHWVLKAVEDNPDADYVVEDGYAHWRCTQQRLAEGRRDPFAAPEPPEFPRRR
jgi:hypothetical protein